MKVIVVKSDGNTWIDKGFWSTGAPSKWMLEGLELYKIGLPEANQPVGCFKMKIE